MSNSGSDSQYCDVGVEEDVFDENGENPDPFKNNQDSQLEKCITIAEASSRRSVQLEIKQVSISTTTICILRYKDENCVTTNAIVQLCSLCRIHCHADLRLICLLVHDNSAININGDVNLE